MTGPGTDGFLPLRPGHGVYILGKKVRGMFTWTGAWGQTTRGVVCRSQGPEGGGEERAPRGGPEGGRAGILNLSSYTHTHTHTQTPLYSQPNSHTCALTRKACFCLLPCTPGPHAFPTSTPGSSGSQREGSIWKAGGLGQSSSWRAGVGGVGGAKGPVGGGWAPGTQLQHSWSGPTRD